MLPGFLTEEQFQSMCHDLDEVDKRRFRAGCRDYWKKLGFGEMKFVLKDEDIYELSEEQWNLWLQRDKPKDIENYGIKIGVVNYLLRGANISWVVLVMSSVLHLTK